jgi:hypothetical protein
MDSFVKRQFLKQHRVLMITLYKNKHKFESKESHDLCFHVLLLLEEYFYVPGPDSILRLSLACNQLVHRLKQESDEITFLLDVTRTTLAMIHQHPINLEARISRSQDALLSSPVYTPGNRTRARSSLVL